jgi:hypothetical protein
MIRWNEDEQALVKKLAERSKSKTLSGYIRAAALNRRDDGEVFRDIRCELIRLNAEVKAAPPGPVREQAIAATTAYMLWVMDQK